MMVKTCSICGKLGNSDNIKGKILFGNDFCIKHLLQMKKYGKIINDSQRTIYDKNLIIINKNYAEIILTNVKCEEIARTKIDKEDVKILSRYKWCLSNTTGYACGLINRKMSLMHRIIMNNPPCKIDHKNRNRLDNRKNNLRLANNSQNCINRSKNKRKNSSKFIGVSWCPDRKKWISQICIKKKHINLGRYKTEKDAIKVRLKAEKKYFGEYGPQINLRRNYVPMPNLP